MIRQEVKQMQSKVEQEINIVNATAQADAVMIKQQAVANASRFTIQMENKAYQNILNYTGLTAKQLDQYIYYNGLLDHTEGKLIVGLNNAIINFKN